MGMFDIFKKSKNEEVKTVEVAKSGTTINLRKDQINKICLEKKPLNNLVARVVLAVDYSGSMRYMYKNGEVQEVIERIFPIALKFDDDGEMGIWKFSNGCKQLKDMNINNYANYVDEEFDGHMGGTSYEPVISDIRTKYAKREPLNIPTYVIFITDGDCDDRYETEELMRAISSDNIFWQFVGIGNSSFNFLERLDDMEGRFLDNADFFAVKDISEITDEVLYKKLLNEFPVWVEQARDKNMIK